MTREYDNRDGIASAERILPSFFGKELPNNFLTGMLERSDAILIRDRPDYKVNPDGKTVWRIEHFWAQGHIKDENTHWSIRLASIDVDAKKPETLAHLRLIALTNTYTLDFYWFGDGINSKDLIFHRCDDSQRRRILKHDDLMTDVSFSSLYFRSVSLEKSGAKQSLSIELQRPSDLPGLDKTITFPLFVHSSYPQSV